MSAEPAGESTGEIRQFRISPEFARELLRVLRGGPRIARRQHGPRGHRRATSRKATSATQRPEEGIEGLIGF
jgi:hypothetical protein